MSKKIKIKKGDWIYNHRGQKMQILYTETYYDYNEQGSLYLLCKVPPQDESTIRGEDLCEGLVLIDTLNDVFMPVNKETTRLVSEFRVAENTLRNFQEAINDQWLCASDLL